jgi:quinoprotein dehydrogenase-associated probable ABC transporter substrate-binding protein
MCSRWNEKYHVSRRAWLCGAAALAAWPAFADAECPCAAASDDHKDSAAPGSPVTSLRVCADPNNLPFSNRSREGFEDKIAALIARELRLPLEYEWLPQRLGFYRTALKTFDTNLVMAAPAGFEKALISAPYYRSTYVFVCRKDSKIPISSLDDPALRSLRIGVPLTGGYNTPPTHALAKRRLIDNITGFSVFDESDGRPGEKLIAAVANGEIDVAIAWGPQAGYFARRQTVPLALTPVSPEADQIGEATMPYTFAICMALRRPDKALRARINQAIAARQHDIDQILDSYSAPRLPLEAPRQEQH